MATPHYFEKSDANTVLEHFRSNVDFGLPNREVRLRQKEYGKNTTPWFPMLWSLTSFLSPATIVCAGVALLAQYQQLSSPLFWQILIAGGCVQQILYILVQFAKVKSVFTSYLARHRALPRFSTVRRDGKTFRIKSKDLVPGDIIYLESGEKLSGDVRILSSDKLIMDESFLFGPSRSRTAKSSEVETVVFKAYPSNVAFGGSQIISGTAKALVLYTGKKKMHGIHKTNPTISPLIKGFFWQSGLMLIGMALVFLITYITSTSLYLFSWFFLLITPFYIPLYLLGLQVFTHKKDFSFPSNHIITKVENLICTDEKSTILFFNKEEIFLGHAPKLKKHAAMVTSFLELCHLAIPGSLFPSHKHEFQASLNALKQYLHTQYDIEVASENSSLSLLQEASNYTLENNAIGFESKAVYTAHDNKEEVLLTIHTTAPEPALEKAIYIWDMNEKSQKRRFFPNEKQKLKELAARLTEEGYLLYALTLEEGGLAQKMENIYTYVGFMAIPQVAHMGLLKELKKTQELGLKATLVSYTSVPKKFYAEKLGISLQNIIDAEDIKAKSLQYKTHFMEEPLTLVTHSTSDVLLTLIEAKGGVWVERSLGIPKALCTFVLSKNQTITNLFKKEMRSSVAFNQYQLLCLLSGMQTIAFGIFFLVVQWLPLSYEILGSILLLPLLYVCSLFFSRRLPNKKSELQIHTLRPTLSLSFYKTCTGIAATLLTSVVVIGIYILSKSDLSINPIALAKQSLEFSTGLMLLWTILIAIPAFSWVSRKYLPTIPKVPLLLTIIVLCVLALRFNTIDSFTQSVSYTAIIGVLSMLGVILFSSKGVTEMRSK